MFDKNFIDWCEVMGYDPKKVMDKFCKDLIVNSEEYKELREQNQKLIKTLRKYANDKNWRFDSLTGFHTVYQGGEFDDEVHEGFRDARITLIEMGE